MSKKIVLKEDFIIPKGTEFKLIDFTKQFFKNRNLEAVIDMQDTTAGHIYIDPNIEDDRFEMIK
jgi:hypothetical protein